MASTPTASDTAEWEGVTTVDYHTGGEPFRIVADPSVALPGDGVADRRVRAAADPDVQHLRRVLCHEPRGHADMYGGFITPPDDDGAHFGVLFWHKDGFSTACGHGTIALGTWAVESGLVQAPADGVVDVRIDVPSGRVTARVHVAQGRVSHTDFVNVPSHAIARDVEVATSRGPLRVDVGFGGAIYAQLDARTAALAVVPEQVDDLIALGREIKWALNDHAVAQHPTDTRLSGVYGTTIYDDLGTTDDGRAHQRNVTVFADGEVDRSPCGSGTCARVAVLDAHGDLPDGRDLVHDSLVGSRFLARVEERTVVDGHEAVVVSVSGTAHRTGEHRFVVDPADSLTPGFVLR
ncbi:proline racemase family protein [Mumia sp. zg.B21]|uniref:proline racemase family protein n=1 Tax=Mumia sp. zg.B21 TaxID=2855447 RepID=UPI001C6E1686|nr:proline racemase family protein [Mumia sp. zg.B21]MBW9210628.1 proline racemase family protein [Mumia sp. zg.B21]